MSNMKKKRNRERNWTLKEKLLLKRTIQPYAHIINSKGNTLQIIEMKNNAWKKIVATLKPHGVDFSLPKVRNQWTRMKMQARQKTIDKRDKTVDLVEDSSHLDGKCTLNESDIKEEYFDSEISDIGCSETAVQHIQMPSSPTHSLVTITSLREKVYAKKLEQINIQIAQDAVLFEIRKEIEMQKLELIKLQIKKERICQ